MSAAGPKDTAKKEIAKLVFKGLSDESPETLRRAKGAFIADLDLNVADVARILSTENSEILTGSVRDLREAKQILEQAGALTEVLFDIDDAGEELETEMPSEDGSGSFSLNDPSALKDLQAGNVAEMVSADLPILELDLDLDSPPTVVQSQKDPSQPAGKAPAEKKTEEAPQTADEEALFELVDQPAEPAKSEAEEAAESNPADELEEQLFQFEEALKEEAVTKKAADKPVREEIEEDEDEFLLDLEDAPQAPPPSSKPPAAEPPPAPEKKVELQAAEKKASSEPAQPGLSVKPPAESAPPEAAKPASIRSVEETPPSSSEAAGLSYQSHRSRRRKKLSLDKLFIIVLALAALGLVNWFHFSSAAKKAEKSLPEIDEIIPEIQAAKKLETAPTATLKPERVFQGELKKADYHASGSCKVEGGKIEDLHIVVTTPKPPALTPEQVASGQEEPLWLSRVQLDSLSLVQLESGFQGTGKAKVYIEQYGERERVLADARVNGKYDPAQAKVYLTVSVGRMSAKGGAPLVSRAPEGGYSITLRVNLALSN